MLSESTTWMLEALYDANKPDAETVRIYKTLDRYIHDTRQFHGCIEHVTEDIIRVKPLHDLADDCFFSVAFFPDFIKYKNKTHGAPDIYFYSKTGKAAFDKTGWSGIAYRWDFWIEYVHNNIWRGPRRYK